MAGQNDARGMNSEIKILFAADFHLGFKSDEIPVPDYCRLNTFRRVGSIARYHDVLLIGGVLIDELSAGGAEFDIVREEFRSIRHAGTEICYAPARAEAEREDMRSFLADCNATRVFSSTGNQAPYQYVKNGQMLYVYGMNASPGADIFAVQKISEDGFHIGLFNVGVGIENGSVKDLAAIIQKDARRSFGLDFYAIGGCHSFKMIRAMDRIIGVCPGTPEAISFSECGDRYIISIVVADNRITQIKRLTINSVRLHKDEIDCSRLVTMGPIKEILENNQSKKAVQRLVLKGERDFVLRLHDLQKYKNDFFHLDIIDESVPTIDALIEEFQYENTLRGEFYKMLKERMKESGALQDVDLRDLSATLARITRNGFAGLEEWLCGL